MPFQRAQASVLTSRLFGEPRRFIQVVAGPRQVGKTTLVQQVLASGQAESVYASADEPGLRGLDWIEAQWNAARIRSKSGSTILALDEIQKIPWWSETVKRLWDQDSASGLDVRVVILGSAPLLIQTGLTESLAGRFETIRLGHWSLSEMRDAFGFTLEEFVHFGGYPGAAGLIREEQRWSAYIRDSLIETTISRDILLMARVHKPALLRRLFELGCGYSGRILSYQKMIGQLQDAGNTTTLAHYLDLVSGAGMLTGLQKYAGQQVRRRGSSPKLQVYNNALVSAMSGRSFEGAQSDAEYWGHLVESSVGSHLVNLALTHGLEIFYWNERNHEVDFVVRQGGRTTAIEVKTGRPRRTSGLRRFQDVHQPDRVLVVGEGGVPLDEFFSWRAADWAD